MLKRNAQVKKLLLKWCQIKQLIDDKTNEFYCLYYPFLLLLTWLQVAYCSREPLLEDMNPKLLFLLPLT